MATVRYFAAAGAAAGVSSEIVDGATLGVVLDAAKAAHGATFAAVLGRCSVLVDGVAGLGLDAPVTPGATIDVLPPFAGG